MREACSVDFESSSPVPIELGGFLYAKHPDTYPICLGYAFGDEPPKLWRGLRDREAFPGWQPDPPPDDLFDYIRNGGLVRAWNAYGFDWPFWTEVMVKRWGWPELPLEQVRDTMVEAQAMGFPGALAQAGPALGFPAEAVKSRLGRDVMFRCCVPWHGSPAGELWGDKPRKRREVPTVEDYQLLEDYCKQDVIAERNVAKKLVRLPPTERRLAEITTRMNMRGVQLDADLGLTALRLCNSSSSAINDELHRITSGSWAAPVNKISRRNAVVNYLRANGELFDNLKRRTMERWLVDNPEAPELVKTIVSMRRTTAKASLGKLKRVAEMAVLQCSLAAAKYGDLALPIYVYGASRFNGASTTGRWSATGGLQLQNVPRPVDGFKQDKALDWINTRTPASVGWDDRFTAGAFDLTMLEVASMALRGLIVPRPGHKLVVGDFASVEARGIAWLADCQKLLRAFRDKLDVYSMLAELIFNHPVNKKDNPEERQAGKVGVLSSGYGIGGDAMQDFLPYPSPYGLGHRIVKTYREEYHEVPSFWYRLRDALVTAVKTGVGQRVGPLLVGLQKIRCGDTYLNIILPSGRRLWFYKPRVIEVDTPWGMRESVEYYGFHIAPGRSNRIWGWQNPHPGAWAGIVTQAMCRDFLAHALIKVEDHPYMIPLLTVHDELVCEAESWCADYCRDELERIMGTPPEWAKDFPLDAEVQVLDRYRK